MAKTLDDILQHIKNVYAERVNAVKADTTHVREAVTVYERAAEEDCLNDFLVANGLAPPATVRKVEDAALDLLHAVENLPELRTSAPSVELPVQVPDDEEELPVAPVEAPPPDAYPLLKRDGRPIVLFGGFAIPAKLQALEQRTGLKFEWISNERNGSGDNECDNVCRQLRNGRYSGLIILNELVAHGQSAPLIRAAKLSNVGYASGRKGGIGVLIAILNAFENQLKSRLA